MHALDQLRKIDRSQNIDGWNVRVYFLSRSPLVLSMMALVILTIALSIAWSVEKPVTGNHFETLNLQSELSKSQPDIRRVLDMLPSAAGDYFEEVSADTWIQNSKLSEQEKMVSLALWSSLRESDEESENGAKGFEPSADLIYYAHYIIPLRFANEFMGDHYLAKHDLTKAGYYYRRECRFPDALEAQTKLVGVLVDQRDRAELRKLADDPQFRDAFRPEHKVYFAALEHRWKDMISPLMEVQRRMLQPVPLTVAAIAGLVWFLIALQAIQPPRLLSIRTLLPILAVSAGMASTFPTLLASLWMEEATGLRMDEQALSKIVYFMLGVGPREEMVKLFLFLPFLPVLLKRGSRLETIVVAGCVGLGFAVWENLHYFAKYGSAVAFPRFLTANFFHFALTGLNGSALCNFLRKPVHKFLPLVGTLLGTTLAHGAYDTLATFSHVPLLELACMMVFMIVSLFFFHVLHGLRDGSTDHLCIAGTLVVGLSVLAGAIIVFAARDIGLESAVSTFAVTGIGMIMVGYMFFWQLGEGMSAAAHAINRTHAR